MSRIQINRTALEPPDDTCQLEEVIQIHFMYRVQQRHGNLTRPGCHYNSTIPYLTSLPYVSCRVVSCLVVPSLLFCVLYLIILPPLFLPNFRTPSPSVHVHAQHQI